MDRWVVGYRRGAEEPKIDQETFAATAGRCLNGDCRVPRVGLPHGILSKIFRENLKKIRLPFESGYDGEMKSLCLAGGWSAKTRGVDRPQPHSAHHTHLIPTTDRRRDQSGLSELCAARVLVHSKAHSDGRLNWGSRFGETETAIALHHVW